MDVVAHHHVRILTKGNCTSLPGEGGWKNQMEDVSLMEGMFNR